MPARYETISTKGKLKEYLLSTRRLPITNEISDGVMNIVRTLIGLVYICIPFSAPRSLSTAIDITTAGASVQQRLVVSRKELYYFYIDIVVDPSQRLVIKPLMGSGAVNPNGRRVDNGMRIPVHLAITRLEHDSGTVLLDKHVQDLELQAWKTNTFVKLVYSLTLDPGIYDITMVNDRSNTELNGVTADFITQIRLNK